MPDMPPLTPRRAAASPPRKTRQQRGYDARHFAIRAQLLKQRPICEICNNAWASHAHHLRYPALSVEDYQSLCPACHKQQHT